MQYMYRCELPDDTLIIQLNNYGCNTCIDVSCQNTDVMKNQAVDGCNTCIRNKNQKLRKGELRI